MAQQPTNVAFNLFAAAFRSDCAWPLGRLIEMARFTKFREEIKRGAIDGINEEIPEYVPKGVGSWKAFATRIQAVRGDGDHAPVWTPTFEGSDYRKFHDTVKENRFVITQEILPKFGIRLV